MAIRKRYIGRIRVSETKREIYVESAKMSKIEVFGKNKVLPHVVRELFDEALSDAKISAEDIEAFCIAESMSGLYGIPEFMRYIFPSSIGSHKIFYEVGCEESAGLCAIVKACELINSGLFSRICVISANKVQLEGIDKLSEILFSEVLANTENFFQDYMKKAKLKHSHIKEIFEIYYRKAKSNPFASPYPVSKADIRTLPKIMDGVGVAIIFSPDVVKIDIPSSRRGRTIPPQLQNQKQQQIQQVSQQDEQKKTKPPGKVKIVFSGETTMPSSGTIFQGARFLAEQAYEKLGITEPKISIKVAEVYDFIPPLSAIWAETLKLSDEGKGIEFILSKDSKKEITELNPSGGVFFANAPPVSSFARFFSAYRYLIEECKSGDRGIATSMSLRTFEHSALVVLERV